MVAFQRCPPLDPKQCFNCTTSPLGCRLQSKGSFRISFSGSCTLLQSYSLLSNRTPPPPFHTLSLSHSCRCVAFCPQEHSKRGEGMIQVLCSETHAKLSQSWSNLLGTAKNKCINYQTSLSLTNYIQIYTHVIAVQRCRIASVIFLMKSGVYYSSDWWSIKCLHVDWYWMCGSFFCLFYCLVMQMKFQLLRSVCRQGEAVICCYCICPTGLT